MSALAKVFVVFVFLLSVFFFGSSAVLFKTRTDWRKAYNKLETDIRKDIEELKKVNAELTARNDENLKNIALHKRDADSLSNQLKQKNQDLNEEKAKVKLAASQAEKANLASTTLSATLDKTTAQSTGLQEALDKLKAAHDQALQTTRQANEERDIMRLDLAKVQEDLHASRKELTELTENYETLKINFDAMIARHGDAPGGPSATPPRPIDALVNAVDNKEKLVVISVGKDQKVETGYEFTVFRGDQFIGKVKVIKVYPDLAGARILWTKEGAEIQRGDKASTFAQSVVGG